MFEFKSPPTKIFEYFVKFFCFLELSNEDTKKKDSKNEYAQKFRLLQVS